MLNAIRKALPFAGRARRAQPFKELGTSGTAIYGGYVASKESRSDLTGAERYKSYSQILAGCSTAAAGVRYFLNLASGQRWQVTPADPESAEAKDYAERVEAALHDMSRTFESVVRRSAMYRFMGFSIQEWTAKRRANGDIGFLDIEPRPQWTIERWDVDDSGKVRGVEQLSPQTGQPIYLPIEKLVYCVDDSLSDSPEGVGLLRHVKTVFDKLQRYEQLEEIGYETDMRGIPVGRAPLTEINAAVKAGTLKTTDANALLEPLKQFLQNHIKGPSSNGLLLDSDVFRDNATEDPSAARQWDLSLLENSINGQADIAQAISRKNREIARVLGVEHILLGEGQGSHALSRDKTQNFFLTVNGTLTELAATYERALVNTMWRLNGWPDEMKPELSPEKVRHMDTEAVAAGIRDIAASGVLLDRSDEAVQEYFEIMGLTPPDPDMVQSEQLTPNGGMDNRGRGRDPSQNAPEPGEA